VSRETDGTVRDARPVAIRIEAREDLVAASQAAAFA
jgi:hypothetical protein